MTEAVIGETQGLGQHPAFAVVLGEEGLDAALAVASGRVDLRLDVVEGDESQDGVTQFRFLVAIDAPEAANVESAASLTKACDTEIDILQNVSELAYATSVQDGDNRIHDRTQADSFSLL